MSSEHLPAGTQGRDGITAPSPSPFDLLRARGLIGQFLLLFVAEVMLYTSLTPAGARHADTSREERLVGVLLYATLALVLAVRARRAGLRWRALLGPPLTRELLPLVAMVVPVAILTVGAAIVVYVPLSYAAPRLVEQLLRDSGTLFETGSLIGWLELVFVGVVVAPVVEEVMFRGFLLHRWARRWGTVRGVVASSALFAVLHGEWIGHFVFGVVMALLYLRTRRLWMPIAAHALNNALAALTTLPSALRGEPSKAETLAELRAEWPVGLVALALGSVLLWWGLRRWWPGGAWRAELRGPTPYDGGSPRPS